MFCVAIFAVTVVNAQDASKQQPAVSQTQTQNTGTLPSATIKELLPDGSYLVSINGQTFKAFDEGYVRDIMKSLEELDRAKLARGALEKQIATYEDSQIAFKNLVATADGQTEKEARIAGGYQKLWQGEHNLRITAEQLRASTQPHGIDKLLNHPAFKIAERFAKPAFETWWNGRHQTTVIAMTNEQAELLRTQQIGRPYIVLRQ
jgi:hypothetical protein